MTKYTDYFRKKVREEYLAVSCWETWNNIKFEKK